MHELSAFRFVRVTGDEAMLLNACSKFCILVFPIKYNSPDYSDLPKHREEPSMKRFMKRKIVTDIHPESAGGGSRQLVPRLAAGFA